MRGLSIIVLLVAVMLGAIAVVGVRSMLLAQRTDINVAADADTVTVVVATKALEFGTEITPEVVREVPWPANAVPEDTFSSLNDLIGGERRVALRSIQPNEPLLKDRVSGFGGRASLSQIITEGNRAVTIRVNDVSGAGGFVLPGDRVDVLSTVNPTNNRLDAVTNILLDDVRVLAIDQLADENQGGAVVVKAATLEVTPEDSQKIALASSIGTLSLTLRNAIAESQVANDEDASEESDESKTVGFADLGFTPTKPARVQRAADTGPRMRVTRGTQRSSHSVRRDRGVSLGTPTGAAQPPAPRQPGQTTGLIDSMQSTATNLNKLTAPVGDGQ
ncbi:MAG: Flp pilus assembly protein CpaB [Marinicaulis sp.]|nr:Flp pilus assembly protein CpaB [Marinicaulis sp.]NNE41481.1 Flp pilus assembly protein CpaB [Marinicaulis sp.]NNL89724.1 Flp pilus assembly protein CpaB [Marinicaulis sp.]